LERDRELESLRAALADAADGEGRLALVEGPAGIGKTRLLAELRAAAAEDGARVLSARGSELEQALYVTPKTVEVHLSNAYRKLDIASRRELPAALTPSTP
jgi:ATP/maltotriose-dependent transcriptional regulator MalT